MLSPLRRQLYQISHSHRLSEDYPLIDRPQSCIWCKGKKKNHSFIGSQETKQTEQDIHINANNATNEGKNRRLQRGGSRGPGRLPPRSRGFPAPPAPRARSSRCPAPPAPQRGPGPGAGPPGSGVPAGQQVPQAGAGRRPEPPLGRAKSPPCALPPPRGSLGRGPRASVSPRAWPEGPPGGGRAGARGRRWEGGRAHTVLETSVNTRLNSARYNV